MRIIHYAFIILVLLLSVPVHSRFSLDNTPFDPNTWRDTIRNTPFDPNTWRDTIDDARNPGGAACSAYARSLMNRYRSTRGLNYTEKYYLRPWFKDLVDKVTVFWGASLNSEIRVAGRTIAVSSAAQTFGYRIFIRERRRTADPYQLIMLAHELYHAWQYKNLGESLKKFCRAYSNGYFRGGMNYFNNPLERQAIDFEIKFAQWLGREHPNPNAGIIQYQTGSPYQRRTARVPSRLKIPSREYAVTCIENRTNGRIKYSSRWGNQPWKSHAIASRTSRWHSWPYEGGRRSSPDLKVRFDYDLSGGVRYRTYTLKRYRTKEESCDRAKPYHFAKSGNTLRLIDSE